MHTRLTSSATPQCTTRRQRTKSARGTHMLATPRLLWATLMLAGLGALGCATVGSEFPVAPVDEIVIGQTTQADIQRMFGNPWRIGVDDGDTTWTYGHYKYKLFGRARTRDLVVRFDANGTVSSYSFNTTEHEDRAMGKKTS